MKIYMNNKFKWKQQNFIVQRETGKKNHKQNSWHVAFTNSLWGKIIYAIYGTFLQPNARFLERDKQ